ncbi:TonB-dependent receptor [Melioribacter sp. OK-6-Me]|uniref:TonB-dependent receptor n=1 Tax=unclassified Melioribacter TaxID=2627329 RepID=UPI003EDA5D81
MKKILFVLTLVISGVNAQTHIEGRVIDISGNPIPEANVILVGTEYGTSSDKNGIFKLVYPLKPGDLISVSCVGYESKTIQFNPSINFLTVTLDKKEYSTEAVVVTGTRSVKKLKDTPVITELISEKEIKQCGYISLKEALMEQAGIAVINNHGNGIQIQGLDPDYTLILIDGEPAIGRTGGTIELSRFDVANLKQIEIVKGPSSSLYGSEALAGVVNLITTFPDEPKRVALFAQAGTHNSYQINGEFFKSFEKFKGSLVLNTRGSEGYDLTPESISKSAPEYNNFLVNTKLEYQFDEWNSARFSLRYFGESQNNFAEITENDKTEILKDKNWLQDLSLSLTYFGKINHSYNHQFKFYISNYYTESELRYQLNEKIYEYSQFDQYYYKGEYTGNLFVDQRNLTTLGVGYVKENVSADRISKDADDINSHFIFLQHEWIPLQNFDIVGGLRYDYHNKYSSRISPKLSAIVKPYDFLKLNFSIGSGFKAPTLQQLYLNFTNPQVGYSVFGSTNFLYYFNKLIEEGQVDKILINPESINKLNAENSWSFNFTIEYEPLRNNWISLNFFRNNVRDLIDATPVAIKKNGQSIYTYFNLNKIYTQGIESEIRITVFDHLKIGAGYQYLDAVDEGVLEKIKAGEYYKYTETGRLKKVTEADYGGLFNRSRHSGNFRLSYENETLGLSTTLTGILKGKYGYYDKNGNGILDDKSEYAAGFALWNFALNKSINYHFSLRLRIENLLNRKFSGQNLNLSGRIIYAGISINY